MRIFRCIDDEQVFNFLGDFTKDNINLFAMDFVKCDRSNKTLNCYNDEELNVRLRDFGGYFLYSTQRFAIDKYDGEAIQDEVKLFFFTI